MLWANILTPGLRPFLRGCTSRQRALDHRSCTRSLRLAVPENDTLLSSLHSSCSSLQLWSQCHCHRVYRFSGEIHDDVPHTSQCPLPTTCQSQQSSQMPDEGNLRESAY